MDEESTSSSHGESIAGNSIFLGTHDQLEKTN